MGCLRALGKFIWRFMVIFSFIVNIVLVVVLIGLGVMIFEIKKTVADPLIGGLHSTAVGLGEATIDWTIPVRDNIPVNLDIELKTDTVVVLNEDVPLTVNAIIDLPGINAFGVNARVNLRLPAGLALPVALDVPVPVRERLDVSLDVRAVIPLSETQLIDPIDTLALLFEPLAIGLHNLPSDFNQAGDMIGKVLRGESLNLLATDGSGGINNESYVAWPGFSRTAGLNYTLLSQPWPLQNIPQQTGIVPPGGIPFLDELLTRRTSIYSQGGVQTINDMSRQRLQGSGIPGHVYDGSMASYFVQQQALGPGSMAIGGPIDPNTPSDPADVGAAGDSGSLGIIQPETSNP